MHGTEPSSAHLNRRPRQDDPKVSSQLLDGFGKFGFAIFDHVTLIKDAVVKLDVPAKLETQVYTLGKKTTTKKTPAEIEVEENTHRKKSMSFRTTS